MHLPEMTPALVFYSSIRAMGCNLDMDDALIDRMQNELLGMYRDKASTASTRSMTLICWNECQKGV